MHRASRAALPWLVLAGCISNTLATQNLQVSAVSPVRPVPIVRPAPGSPRLLIVRKVTTGGETITLAPAQVLDRDCTPSGQTIVKVTAPPANGTIHVAPGLAVPNHRPGDPRDRCNAQRAPATLVTYRADRGDDGVTLRPFFPDGRALLVRDDVTVGSKGRYGAT